MAAATETAPSTRLRLLKLTLGHSCYQNLTWECELVDRADAPALAKRLSLSFKDESRTGLVRQFTSPLGHSVVLIPSTGRMQLRIHYLTAPAQRLAEAKDLADQLESLMVPQR